MKIESPILHTALYRHCQFIYNEWLVQNDVWSTYTDDLQTLFSNARDHLELKIVERDDRIDVSFTLKKEE